MNIVSTRLGKALKVPFFLYLLSLFFVLHGFTENFFLIPVPDSLLLLGKYLVVSIILNAIFFLIFRNNTKASLFSFFILALQFFFGPVYDNIKTFFGGSFIFRYSFILPFILICLFSLFFIIKKRRQVEKAVLYLNVLLCLLIVIDAFVLSEKIIKHNQEKQLTETHPEFSLCDTCRKPDVYFIIADEYAGSKTLSDLYGFDNSAFLNQLRERKFEIVENSVSNYNITPVSIASIHSLNYPSYQGNDLSEISMKPIYQLIDSSILVSFFRFQGYQFINNSVFTVGGQPPSVSQPYIPARIRIMESQTFTSRVLRDIGYHLVEWKIIKAGEEDTYQVLNSNTEMIESLKEQALIKKDPPRFIYTHLTMPHFPYYFNKEGKPYEKADILEGGEWLEYHYLEYLQYTNKVLTDLVDYIIQHAKNPPVIILMSDHGFRLYSKETQEHYDFYNLIATYLPVGYHPQFHAGMANLSYMCSLLNLLFNQQLSTDRQDRHYIPIPMHNKNKIERDRK